MEYAGNGTTAELANSSSDITELRSKIRKYFRGRRVRPRINLHDELKKDLKAANVNLDKLEELEIIENKKNGKTCSISSQARRNP